ncbi:hypothetical protein MY04_0542 [Flammeovirga sp. MY04]|uniref:MutS-related protein n=1 Tax=Flammeovirga sp. MY04 TaxID=1191459 RepID=UPI000806203B|nr:hypothetical protein [Flammeovirga sp. MY04]ANQ47924.1 hypothetical protein MY04_0542 [Flammeovirga sp. MY04]
MSLHYQEEINKLNQFISSLEKKSNQYSFLRLIYVVASIGLSFIVYNYLSDFLWISILVEFLGFAVVVRLHQKILSRLSEYKVKYQLIENELNTIKGEANIYSNGEEFINPQHHFANDLDIFGEFGLFHFINRAKTRLGKTKLASFFQEVADVKFDKILERRGAVNELSDKKEFSNQFQYLLFDNENEKGFKPVNTDEISKFELKNEKIYLYYSYLVLVLWCVVVYGLVTTQEWVGSLGIGLVIANFFVMSKVGKGVAAFMELISNSAETLEKLSQLIKLIGEASFTSKLLQSEVAKIGNGETFLKPLKDLSYMIQQLDIRRNLVGLVMLYAFFPFDIRLVKNIRNWFNQYPQLFDDLYDVIGQLEAINSLAILQRNKPEWVEVEYTDKEYVFEGVEMGHPLIFEGISGTQNEGVANSYHLKNDNRVSIITGSNMSGKSTFLRVAGINLVLSYIGSVVCAKQFSVGKPVKLITSMRISDNLRLSESTFKAELERIKLIVEAINSNQRYLFLVDEMLRGTNSVDKLKGSFALLEKLKENKDAFILVATHDLQLSEFESDNSEMTKNYHFDFDYHQGGFEFDYKIKSGVCEKFNASLLMKELGLNT